MIQVFRALRVSSSATFFAAVNILDRYFISKHKENCSLGPESLYLLGMTSVLLSSKFVDIQAIGMKTLIEKAGHGRFKHEQILEKEGQVLQALKFRIHKVDSV